MTEGGADAQLLGEVRVLVLLDQPLVTELVRLTLNHGVYVTRDVADGRQASRVLTAWQPHVALLDMELTSPALLRHLGADRPGGTRVPVLALTRRGDLKTKLAAFELGVDDIMTVPFSPEELLARVLVITRRTYGERVPLHPVLKIGELELDILNRRVVIGEHELHLTGLELSLLYLLAANAGRVISRDEVLDTLWGPEYIAESNVVDRHVRNLRAKLQDDRHNPRFIATVPGVGYRFIAPVG